MFSPVISIDAIEARISDMMESALDNAIAQFDAHVADQRNEDIRRAQQTRESAYQKDMEREEEMDLFEEYCHALAEEGYGKMASTAIRNVLMDKLFGYEPQPFSEIIMSEPNDGERTINAYLPYCEDDNIRVALLDTLYDLTQFIEAYEEFDNYPVAPPAPVKPKPYQTAPVTPKKLFTQPYEPTAPVKSGPRDEHEEYDDMVNREFWDLLTGDAVKRQVNGLDDMYSQQGTQPFTYDGKFTSPKSLFSDM